MWDEERPQPKSLHDFIPRDLTPLSKDELKAYQQFCEAEIIRAAMEISKRQQAEEIAAALFKK